MSARNLLLALAVAALSSVACDENAGERACIMSPTTLESGLEIEDLECGEGRAAERGDVVTVGYSAALEDGAPLPPEDDYTFALGREHSIAGWDEGIRGMQVGGTRRLVIPPELAFGDGGVEGLVPPSATLVFEVELLDVSDARG